MYRATYSYEGHQEHTLDFIEGDQFTVMDTRDQYWWLVQNGFGEIGYVPANYLEADEAAFTEVLKSVDRAIEAIHFQATCAGGNYTAQQRSNLQKLLQHRKNLVEENRLSDSEPAHHQLKRQAPAPPATTSAGSSHHSISHNKQLFKRDSLRSSGSKRAAPQPPSMANGSNSPSSIKSSTSSATSQAADCQSPTSTTSASSGSGSEFSYHPPAAPPPSTESQPISSEANRVSDRVLEDDKGTQPHKTLSSTPPTASHSGYMTLPTPSKSSLHIPSDIGTELVEQIRRNTDLSYNKSRIAVGTVLGCLKERIPSVGNVMDDVLKNLLQSKRDSDIVESSQDAMRLQVIFSEMAACKDDSQQRSWALHEDESVITEYLQELISILNNANIEISKHVIIKDNYDAVHTLVLYYQMETRVSIRLLLLQAFGALCGIDAVIISELLNSILPVELARDMQTHVDDIQKLSYSALVLTMIFSMGESIPVQHYEQLSKTFINFLLDNIESNDHEQIPDLFVNLILAFNLHYEIPSENDVMKVLAERGTAKTFTEKVMLLVNRGEDPVRMFEHKPKPPNSLLKLMSDLYSSRQTSGLLYTNDARVLIDIVLRQITDLSAHDKMRTEYLSLMHLILKNSDYEEHMHRRNELEIFLERVMSEEGPESEMDRRIVRQIWTDFPQYFSSFV